MIKKLNNGLKVNFVKTDSKKIMAGIIVKAGASEEKEGEAGIAHLLEHSVFRRTKNLGTEYLKFIRENQISYNAFTDNHITAFWAETTKQKVGKIIYFLKEVVLNTEFKEEDVNAERTIVNAERNMYIKDYEDWVKFSRKHYSCNKKYSIIGEEEDILNCPYEKILAFYKNNYQLGNMEFLILGKYNKKEQQEILEVLNLYLGSLELKEFKKEKRREKTLMHESIEPKEEGNNDYYITFKDNYFSKKENKEKIKVFNLFFRRVLNDYLREEKNYCYSIFLSEVRGYKKDETLIKSSIPVQHKAEEILKEFDKTLELIEKEFTEEKLEQAKNTILEKIELYGDCEKNSFFFSEEVSKYETIDSKRFKDKTNKKEIENINSISLKDLKEVLEVYKNSKIQRLVF